MRRRRVSWATRWLQHTLTLRHGLCCTPRPRVTTATTTTTLAAVLPAMSHVHRRDTITTRCPAASRRLAARTWWRRQLPGSAAPVVLHLRDEDAHDSNGNDNAATADATLVPWLVRCVASASCHTTVPCSMVVEALCVQHALQWQPPSRVRGGARTAQCRLRGGDDDEEGDDDKEAHTPPSAVRACAEDEGAAAAAAVAACVADVRQHEHDEHVQNAVRWLVQRVTDTRPRSLRGVSRVWVGGGDDDGTAGGDGDDVCALRAPLTMCDAVCLLVHAVRDDAVAPQDVCALMQRLLPMLARQQQLQQQQQPPALHATVDVLLNAATTMHTSSVVLALTVPLTRTQEGTSSDDDDDDVPGTHRVWRSEVSSEVALLCVQRLIAAVRRCHGCGAPPHDVVVLHALHTCVRAALASLRHGRQQQEQHLCNSSNSSNKRGGMALLCMRALRYAPMAVLCRELGRLLLCDRRTHATASLPPPPHDDHDHHQRPCVLPHTHHRDGNIRSDEGATAARAAASSRTPAAVCDRYAHAALHGSNGVVSLELLNKCLAQCAMSIDVVTQRGLCLRTGDVAVVRCAMRLLLSHVDVKQQQQQQQQQQQHADGVTNACRAVQRVEEGLVHGCALLNALGDAAAVRALHARVPQLRVTAHVIMACVVQHDVAAALEALAALARSRGSGGWPRLSLVAWQVMHEVCALVGEYGGGKDAEHDADDDDDSRSRRAEADMARLYDALVSFRNPSLMVGQLMNSVLAGLCARVTHAPSRLGCKKSSNSNVTSNRSDCGTCTHTRVANVDVAPQALVRHTVPMLTAVLRYLGDDCSPDMVLELLECAVRVRSGGAVALVAAVVSTLQRATSLSLRCLCARAVPHTSPSAPMTDRGGMSFLQYYALYTAHHLRRHDVHDHLCAVWQCDAWAVATTHSGTTRTSATCTRARVAVSTGAPAPPCRAWTCHACGRVNSDRYSYCLCSAMRDRIVVCARCGYAQDERMVRCRSCGHATREHSAADATPSSSSVVHAAGATSADAIVVAAEDNNDKATTTTAALAAAAAVDDKKKMTLVVRRAWVCSACQTQNPARQQLCCVHCRRPTGPLLAHARPPQPPQRQQQHDNVAADATVCLPLPRPFCTCAARDAYTRRVGYCCRCNTYKTRYAAAHCRLWRCACCQQLRSSLERFCPSCPQVECLPAALLPQQQQDASTSQTHTTSGTSAAADDDDGAAVTTATVMCMSATTTTAQQQQQRQQHAPHVVCTACDNKVIADRTRAQRTRTVVM